MKLLQLAENKYNQLLLTLIATFLAAPFFTNNLITSLLFPLTLSVVLVLIVNRIKPNQAVFRLYLVLAGLSFLLQLLGKLGLIGFNLSNSGVVISSLIFLFLLGIPVRLITQEIFNTPKVGADTLKGGVCVYILIGLFWGELYFTVYYLHPDGFRGVSAFQSLSDLFYFSFTTLTTVGYGDITPAIPITRILSNLEGITGLMYPTIFISRLVSLYSSERDTPP
ncbi:hypothetical protein DO97_04705 [Neosynechococcus sphagnicola sy1]|uniref:Potassium channel domain-containing protein n=1 Tax=Neosynechococcus sphagnicola sy1 TaxID=1497020 RepID=A0A098TKH4_9CYAN|nr:potassium channel family protein [Neosynechococcus sphagnicola]KGF72789.1 hypothetical protein DO97_04705 [Neosynechococcus sphagnicola sy1]